MKIPAIKGKIGETIYYIANLTFQQINQLVKRVDSELHTSTSLKEEIQRSLSDNYIKIKQYILNRKDHFFNSLVLVSIPYLIKDILSVFLAYFIGKKLKNIIYNK